MSNHLYVQKLGSPTNEPVIFIHGASVSSWSWQPQLDALSQDYYCIAPDLPGHGKSHALGPFSIEKSVEHIAHLITTLGENQKVSIVGISLGAMVGLRLTQKYPQLVSRLVVSGLNVLPVWGSGTLCWLAEWLAPLCRKTLTITLQSQLLRLPGEYLHFYQEDKRRLRLKTITSIIKEAVTYRIPCGCDQLKIPTLIAYGEYDPITVHRSAEALHKTVPLSSVYMAKDVGHGWNLEAPEEFNDMLRWWLESPSLDHRTSTDYWSGVKSGVLQTTS